MGLDQYASARKGEPTLVEAGTSTYNDENGKEVVETMWENEWADSYDLADWRKHPNLQGFMENLYIEKGGEGEFNCVEVELGLADIDALEASVKSEELPETGGFFFGDDSSELYKKEDIRFCNAARKALKDGYTVIYSSWY